MASRGKQFLDGRAPMMESNLREALQCWEFTERSICDEHPAWNRPKLQTRKSYNKCFSCGEGEVDHMARQCPSDMDSSHLSLLQGRKTLFVMFAARLDTKLLLS